MKSAVNLRFFSNLWDFTSTYYILDPWFKTMAADLYVKKKHTDEMAC